MMTARLRFLVLLCLTLVTPLLVDAQDGELPDEFVSERGFLVRHPVGWVFVENDLLITFGTNRDSVQLGAPLQSGETRTNLIVVAPGDIDFVQRGATALSLLNQMRNLPSADTCADFGDVDFVLSGAHIVYYAEQTCATYDNISMVVAVNDQYFAMLAGTVLHGELDDFRPIFVQILASITFDFDPPSSQMFDGESVVDFNGRRARFTHPENWHIIPTELRRTTIHVLTMAQVFSFGQPNPGSPFALLELGAVSLVIDAPLDFVAPEQRPRLILERLNESTDNDFGEVFVFNYDGSYGARTDASYDTFDNTAVVLMLNEDDYLYANLFTASGEMDDFYEMVLAVLHSADLSNPARPEPGGNVAKIAH